MLSWQVVYLKKANSQAGYTHNVKEDFLKNEIILFQQSSKIIYTVILP